MGSTSQELTLYHGNLKKESKKKKINDLTVNDFNIHQTILDTHDEIKYIDANGKEKMIKTKPKKEE